MKPARTKKIYPEKFRRFTLSSTEGGFAPVLIVLIVFASVAVGASGLFLYQKYSTKAPAETTQKSEIPYSSPSSDSKKTTEPAYTDKVGTNWKTLTTFADSSGKTKYVLASTEEQKITETTTEHINNAYLSYSEQPGSPAIKIPNTSGVESYDAKASANPGLKYIIIIKLGITSTPPPFLIADENGKTTDINFSKMGLGTTIPGQYGLRFGKWVGDTRTFTLNAISGDGSEYEATFDATTGKQIGETKQTKKAEI